MEAPITYEEPARRSIDVALMRFLAPEPSGRQLWYLAGGPGGSGITTARSAVVLRIGAS